MGHILDTETNEEYLPFLSQNQIGSYVQEVRKEYRMVLEELRKTGFDVLPPLIKRTIETIYFSNP